MFWHFLHICDRRFAIKSLQYCLSKNFYYIQIKAVQRSSPASECHDRNFFTGTLFEVHLVTYNGRTEFAGPKSSSDGILLGLNLPGLNLPGLNFPGTEFSGLNLPD